ncbi:SDR family oxidoreductase [candidate division KSB1 bacterium]|nr:SDR family oxidoreductase [candidate division KSB1 bacterium]NIV69287.1 SDR family oxidoreductase [Phycisphaerae bacterium]NIR68553.1 SDR family oxidoreductase [candidate division KSB1 bacterium]NIS22559.1 SDR family oxidoreductase [candidate division KSB1 bacterium]NIT69402.1 SDR family oxidoreductase [candidate division KSB1 bacterium]
MNSLKGKVALITGVSRRSGIGFGIAKRLASEGADLYLHSFTPYDRMMSLEMDQNESELILQELTKHGISVDQTEADFTQHEAPYQVIKAVVNRFGHIDILILNHTHDTLKFLDDLTAEEIDRHLAVNVRAALLLVQQFAKQYNGKSGGRIILLTSGQHLGPMPHMAYVASKGALHQLTCSLADALIEKGITVNTVNPGPTKTYQPDEETNSAVLKRMPLGRWGQPDDASRLICWLVSEDAGWITGQVINSEGGFRKG